MKVSIAQINAHLGDFKYNFELIKDKIELAAKSGTELLVFPELALFGYHPMDLLEREMCVIEQIKYFDKLKKIVPKGIAVLIGAITLNKKRGRKYLNSALLLEKNKPIQFFHKELHPNYDVFDDLRHFEKGAIKNNQFKIKNKLVQILICEDMWGWDDVYAENPILKVKNKNVDLVVNLSASPYYVGKSERRREVALKTAKYFKAPLVYVNLVGAQDELIFDGGSFVIDKTGDYFIKPLGMTEELVGCDISNSKKSKPTKTDKTEELKNALVMGICDFVKKSKFEKVHLGLSGGIDSALVACLAVEALGKENVSLLYLPSQFSAKLSEDLAKDLCKKLGCKFQSINIQKTYEQTLTSFSELVGDFDFGLTNENLQSRVRGLLLMAYSNQFKSLLLTTGNKSEYATGYATLYGDMCGGLAPLGDLLKSQVYDISNLYFQKGLMPKDIIDRAPSAELRPNQKDSDSLPDYSILDKAVDNLVNKKKNAKTEVEKWLAQKIMQTEFKRWQAAPILKVSAHSFGLGRRFPIAHSAYY